MKHPLGLALLLLMLGGSSQAEPLPGGSVESLLAIAREGSADYRLSRLETEAARERIQPAGALPDPMLRIELENITRNGNQSATLNPSRVGDTKYTLLQPLPFWGKRDLKREVAAADAAQADGRTADTWSGVASRIKSLYAQYWLNSKSLRLTTENIDLTDRLEKIAQVRYANGLAAQQDAIRAQVERSNLETEQLGMEADYRQLSASINGMLARSGQTGLAEPEALRPLPVALDAATLTERLQRQNPQLAIEAARIGGAEKSRELAYRNRYPDFALGTSSMQVGDKIDTWGLMLEIIIPLQQGTRRSQEREAELTLDAAAARQEALGYRLRSELSGALANLDIARKTEQVTRTRLLPQAQLTFSAALAGYENGKVDFATLLDAQRQIRNAKQTLLRVQANQQIRLAEIERLLGEDL